MQHNYIFTFLELYILIYKNKKHMKTKTVNVEEGLFKQIKVYCALNNIKIKDFVEKALKNQLFIVNIDKKTELENSDNN